MNNKIKQHIIIIFSFIVSIFLIAQPSESFAKKKIKKIIIDPGHGGTDPGCRGVYSYEKDITLSVSKKLGELIQTNLSDVKVAPHATMIGIRV
jgi:N-acetylmuramoyl-L-alanine amidase